MKLLEEESNNSIVEPNIRKYKSAWHVEVQPTEFEIHPSVMQEIIEHYNTLANQRDYREIFENINKIVNEFEEKWL